MSDLKNVSKLIEKAVAAQLNDYLVYNDLHAPLQSAHEPWHSTETGLMNVRNAPDNDDDDDGSENVSKKMILHSFNLIASIWTRSICQMQATFPGVQFLRILFKFKKRKENWSSCVHVLHKTSN